MMVPAGAPVQSTIDALAPLLAEGDIIIDGGNSNYHDSMRRGGGAARARHRVRRRGHERRHLGPEGGLSA